MKTDKFVRAFAALLLATASQSCQRHESMSDRVTNLESDKKEVAAVVNKFAESWETENIQLLTEIMSHDSTMVNYGTDESEVFVGWESFRTAVEQMFPMFDSIKISARDQVIHMDSAGTVAWFSQMWDWSLQVQGKSIQMNGQRFTGVMKKENGKWVIVQFHNSVPVKPEH